MYEIDWVEQGETAPASLSGVPLGGQQEVHRIGCVGVSNGRCGHPCEQATRFSSIAMVYPCRVVHIAWEISDGLVSLARFCVVQGM